MAVLLDNRIVQTIGPDGKVVTSSQKLSQQDLDAYRELVYAAVGYDKERGDIVTLENVPFFSELHPKEEIQQVPWHIRWQSYILPSIKYASYLVLFVLVYLILFRPITKRVYKTMDAIAPPATQEAEAAIGPSEDMTGKALPSAEQTEEMAALDAATQAASTLAEGSREALATSAIDDQIESELMRDAQVLDMGARKFSVLKRKLSERAQTEPEMVSQLIRSWIQER